MGRTGLNVSSAVKMQSCPGQLPLFNSRPVKQLATGDFHMLALCVDGAVYSWGYSSDGQTGQSTLIHCRTPKRMEYFDMVGASIESITCGSGFSMAKDVAGYLYSWGYGDGGWMGLKPPPEESMPVFDCDDAADYPIIRGHTHIRSFDSTHTVIMPDKVALLKNKIVEKMRCGGAHTIIFASPRPSTVFDKSEQEGEDAAHNMMLLGSDSDEETSAGVSRRVCSNTGRK